MSFRIEQPRCLAHLRATRAPGAQEEDRPALAREGGRWRATHFGMRLCRCIQRPITLPPEYRPAAELSNLVSLKHNIDLIMATATPISSPEPAGRDPEPQRCSGGPPACRGGGHLAHRKKFETSAATLGG